MLQPVDIVVALELAGLRDADSRREKAALTLGMTRRRFEDAVTRLGRSGLVSPTELRPHTRNLQEFLLFGLPYWLPAEIGPVVRGMPAATSGPGLSGLAPPDQPGIGDWVWPDAPAGFARRVGKSLAPIDPIAPRAASADQSLYELLCIVDVLRIGSLREREAARAALRARLEAP